MFAANRKKELLRILTVDKNKNKTKIKIKKKVSTFKLSKLDQTQSF